MRFALFLLAAGIFCTAQPAGASEVFVSCFDPDSSIAGKGTPNPNHYPIVAHRSLPFGTIVEFSRKGRTRKKFIVMERGPHVKGRTYDLDCAAWGLFHLDGTGWLTAHVLGSR